MKLEILNRIDDRVSTKGELWVNGHPQCFTLEPSVLTPVHPAIPSGTYDVALRLSPRFGEITPHILNVPGRDLILIHPGNSPEDTEGCILLGKAQGVDLVFNSRQAFQELMSLIDTSPNDDISITLAPSQRKTNV